MSHRRKGTLAAILLVMVNVSNAACGYSPPPMDFSELPACLAGVSGGMALAVGARANQPVPALPATVQTLLRKTSYEGNKISVVRVDGDPKPAGDAIFKSNALNDVKWNSDLLAFESAIANVITGLRAEKAEANPLAALGLAGIAAGPGGVVVLVDSGLQTMSPLDFTRPGMIDAEPSELAGFLEGIKQLPALHGQALMLAGIGNVAEPQQSLDVGRRANLRAIWTEIGKRAGARCVLDLTELQQGDALPDVPKVSPVPIPKLPDPPMGCAPVVLPDAGSVKFKGDSARFVDETEAAKALQTYADRIRKDKLKVKLTGTTSSAGFDGKQTEGKLKLSRERAETVRGILVTQGVPASDIVAVGAGRDFPGFVNDRDANGNLVPDLAAKNRTVIIEFSGCRGVTALPRPRSLSARGLSTRLSQTVGR